jgi:hypothetical protein
MSKDKKRFAVGTKVWIKMLGAHGVDSIIVGYNKESQLIYETRPRHPGRP